MVNYKGVLIVFLSCCMSNAVLGAVVVRGNHGAGVYVAPQYDNNVTNNWSYRHYYNGDDAVIDDNNNDDINPVVINSDDDSTSINDNDSDLINNDTNNVKIYQFTGKDGVTHFSDLPFK